MYCVIDVGVMFKLFSQTWLIVEKIDSNTFIVNKIGSGKFEGRVRGEDLLELAEREMLLFLNDSDNIESWISMNGTNFEKLPERIRNEVIYRYGLIKPLLEIDIPMLEDIENRVKQLKSNDVKIKRTIEEPT
jgi:hypothetical protein